MSSREIFCRALPRSVSWLECAFLAAGDVRVAVAVPAPVALATSATAGAGPASIGGYRLGLGFFDRGRRFERYNFKFLKSPQRLEWLFAFQRKFAGMLGQKSIYGDIFFQHILVGCLQVNG